MDDLSLLAQAPSSAPAAPAAAPAGPAPSSPAPAAPAAVPAETTSTGQPAPQQVPVRDPGNETFYMFLMMGVIFVIFYYLLIRPQKKKEQERLAMLNKLEKNDRVMTSGGILGTVYSVKDNIVVLKVDEDKDVKVRVTKGSIMQVEREGEGNSKK